MHLEEAERSGGKEPPQNDQKVPAAITDTGCERDLNEDRYAVIECDSGLAWLVCDGMGGVTGGELAAQLAIDAIRRDLESTPLREPDQALRNAILESNRVVVLRRQNQAFANMGTTIVGALFQGSEVAIANVGDSRAYLIRNNAIQQLTVDHTFVQELVDREEIKPEEALSHPQAHILTRCIGSEPGLQVDIFKYWIWDTPPDQQSDVLFLCSDGLYSMISEGEIATIVSTHPPQEACVRLVELAKERGGYDNITLVVVPLGGELRQEAPEGYQRPIAPATDVPKSTFITEISGGRKFSQLFLVIFFLSVLAAVLTVAMMVIMIQ